MTISDSHAAHIRRVKVGFVISATHLEPDLVTQLVGRNPSCLARQGDPRTNAAGQPLTAETVGWWRIDSFPQVTSKDINDHLEYLLNVLLPYRDSLLSIAPSCEMFFDVLWESTYLHTGTGPLLSSRACEGIGLLKAGMGFDIYQIDEEPSA